MCGICGFIHRRDVHGQPQSLIDAMNETMVHRGPDDAGSYVHKNMAIAMRRLSIIDLQTGHQPIANEDKTVWVVLNGEIYNYRELREELRSKGHTFETESDTEVVVHLYEEYGQECFTHLQGMFGIAICDTRNECIVIARDRAGQKPLYYCDTPAACVFGSELRALLPHPDVKCEIDPISLQQYLLGGTVMAPRSIFRGIRTLPAASYCVIEREKTHEPHEYWRYSAPETPEKRPETEWLDMLDDTLGKAVERRLIADVPLGVFLSGGTDSSLITALMCRLCPAKEVKTFSVKIEDPNYDESKWSQWAAEHLGTTHHEFSLSPDELLGMLDDMLAHCDEPFADSSILPTYAVSRMTREHVTVALAGDAGDEVFGGYPKYFAQRGAALIEKIPAFIRKYGMEMPLKLLPASDGSVLLGQGKVDAFFRSIDAGWAKRNQLWVSPFLPQQIAEITGRPVDPAVWFPIMNAVEKYRGPHDVATKAMYLDFTTIMQNVFNVKVDRASMRTSLEVREPFMDTEVLSLAGRMPRHLKVRRMETKYILKKLAERYYPKDFIYRKKWGFGAPVKQWLRGKLRARCEEVLSVENISAAGLVDPQITQKLVKEHVSGEKTHTSKVWALFCLHVWYTHWGK